MEIKIEKIRVTWLADLFKKKVNQILNTKTYNHVI